MKNLILTLSTILSFSSVAGTWVVKTNRQLSASELERLSRSANARIEKFAPGHRRGQFSALYVWEGKEKPSHPLIVTVEDSFPLVTSSIIPNPRGERVVADPLFGYQWGLYNQEQTLVKEEDDIRNIRIPGKKGADLNWKVALARTRLSGKTPLVAIVDTGVDYKHPELSHAIERNAAECASADPKKDSDGNGLPGDCWGWNFTAPLNSASAQDPMDLAGHGTHLTGLIAARQDEKGIVGLAPSLRILAVKVLNDGETESADDGTRLPMSDRLARGLIYAVDRGADVINLSLGWPRSLETDYLRKAVAYALSKGRIIVAAAGNNNSSEPIFPCAIEGVICVGATTIDGTWAGFSNFGSSVDLLAPGEAILSTVPTSIEPDLFNVPGYDIKSGTSQAAPYVSGAVAVLKALHPEWSVEKLKAKLLASTTLSPSGSKYATSGNLDLNTLLNSDEIPSVVRPQFKLLRQLLFNISEVEKSFTLPIKNLGAPAAGVTVKVSTDSAAIEILGGEFLLGDLREGESKPLQVSYAIKDLDAHSQIPLKVELTVGGTKREFQAEIPLVRDIRKDKTIRGKLFRFAGPVLPVGTVQDGQVRPLLNTVDDLHPSGRQEFFMRKIVPKNDKGEEPGVSLVLFRTIRNEVVQVKTPLFIKGGTQLISFTRMDVNYDGREDYFMQTMVDEGGTKKVLFSYYDENLSPLFGEDSEWSFTPEVAVINGKTLRFMAHPFGAHGRVAVPVFAASGRLPEKDQDPSPWVQRDGLKRERIYLLVPEKTSAGVEVRTRSVNTNAFNTKTLEDLNLAWDESVDFVDMLDQSELRYKEGKVDVLFSIGQGIFRKLRRLTLSSVDQYAWSTYSEPNIRLETAVRQNLYSLAGPDFYHGGEAYVSFFGQETAQILTFFQKPTPMDKYTYRHGNKYDTILSHLASYKEETGGSHFLQTKSKLVLIRKSGETVKNFQVPILRFSFLPGKLLSELYYPIFLKQAEAKRPALYVDSTQITANRIHVLVSNPSGLVAPARFSLSVPAQCKSLNPLMSADRTTFQYNLLCIEEEGWTLKTLELK